VLEAALEVLKSGNSTRLHFGVADDEAWDVGLACGGEIEVYIRKFDERAYEILNQAFTTEKAFCTGLVLDGNLEHLGQDNILLEDGSWLGPDLPSDIQDILIKTGLEFFNEKSSDIIQATLDHNWEVFLQLIEPEPTLIIIGGVHIAIPLTRMAEVMGFDVIVIDPRRLFGSRERFPSVKQLLSEWPESAFHKIKIDSSTAIVMLTHDPKIDDPAIKIALKSDAFYIGALGSNKTHQKRIERLVNDGIDHEELDRLHAPVGLDIGGGSPQEIALSVISEIVKVWNSIP
jgi:xanthine dehydrogenase accessory factor